jgi:Ca2+-transporting ATPase
VDIVTLAEGDRVPTDALLHAAQDLEADESLLTGESVPARKVAASDNAPQGVRPGRDGAPAVWSGTLIVRGTGIAELFATGPRTEIGRIGCSLAGLETEPPRLQAQTRHVVTLFALAGAIVSIGVVILSGLFRGGWLEALLAGIAIGMPMLPEEFPVVLTIFMAMGAWRISRARVLTRRASAVDPFGPMEKAFHAFRSSLPPEILDQVRAR